MGSKTEKVLAAIRTAQESPAHGYKHALSEIRHGRKQSCWIWWVWPSLSPVRETSRPQYDLPDLRVAKAYLQCPILSARLSEITEVAVTHLRSSASPRELLGSTVDVEKFHQTMTYFAVVAVEAGDAKRAAPFLDALTALGGALEKRTMAYVVGVEGFSKYRDVDTSALLAAMIAPESVHQEIL
eukprot:gnl/TRDRNA2_/TRDRNA2_82848_c0_seq2.p1 gnl/TRDRNA2_/TRDRNA2_82848_c0~~gnl/TRDRNA2_/TRDRNA2_82848_c0_seq2.p1  ORF type:complete len:184 (+),score=24.09 gnl/TRDRNA2_/TRDRNA2_82848_c0_seq2:34-585(+)